MLEITVDVLGIEDMMKSLEATKADAIKVKSLKEAGTILKTAIEEATPEAAVPPTSESTALPQGALKNDVEMHVSRSNHSVVVGYGKWTRHVARWLEFGFHRFKTGKFINARIGFFRGAVEAALPEAQATLKESLLTNIAKAFKGGEIDAA
jgi:hypothetical protein